MRRLLILALLALSLAGCGSTSPAETPPPSDSSRTETPTPTEGKGLYDPAGSLALAPGGAVRCHSLEGLAPASVRVMGGELVLFSTGETTTLITLSGESRYVSASLPLPFCLSADDPGTQVSAKGITYYDEAQRTMVFLNTNLEEVNRIQLPDTIRQAPVLSQDRKVLYYATEDSLRSFDLETRLDRLLLQAGYDRLELKALHLDGSVLECLVQDGQDLFHLYLRTDTGETLETTSQALDLSSNGQLYFLRLEDGRYPELLTGLPDQDPYVLEPMDYLPTTIPVMELNSLLTVAQEEASTRLELYDLRIGDRTASLTLPLSGDCRSVAGDVETGGLWIIFSDGQQELLLFWDPQLSPVEDDRVYRLPRRSAQNPDLAGLEACAQTARELGEAYGIDIHIWQDALAVQPGDYRLEGEYRVPLIRHCLEELAEELARYPEGFFDKLVPGKDKLQLCLTGTISGVVQTQTLATALGTQFWDEEGVPYVAITLGSTLAPTFHHELFHVIDSRVLSACSLYDQWNDLNPEGFDYDYSYSHPSRETDQQWTSGPEQAFIDTYAMSFPREDRARIMEMAMTEGCAGTFAGETMQRKLHTLCTGIRKAFKLEKAAQVLPWEQYLAEPLAYKT